MDCKPVESFLRAGHRIVQMSVDGSAYKVVVLTREGERIAVEKPSLEAAMARAMTLANEARPGNHGRY